eukprot:6558043-Alexandrium_andersonii.AAC.1
MGAEPHSAASDGAGVFAAEDRSGLDEPPPGLGQRSIDVVRCHAHDRRASVVGRPRLGNHGRGPA